MKIRSRLILCLLAAPFLADCIGAETISFRADSMSGKSTDNSDYTKLEGNAFIKTKDMEISADTIELSGKDFRFVRAQGAVSGKSTESGMEFSCELMRYDRKTEIAFLEQDVHLIDSENDVAADAQLVEYNQRTDVSLLQIHVKLVQKDTVCTSEFAVYRKKEQLLEMSGNPQVVRNQDTFRAQEIMVDLETEEITLNGRVSGTVTETDKKDGGADG